MTKEALVTKIKHIIKAQKKIHIEWNGRPGCKNCSLMEDIGELIDE